MDSIVDCLAHWAAVQPRTCFSSFLDIAGTTRESYSYADFEARTRKLAEALSRQTGLRYGDRVLLVYPPGLEAIVAFLACARMGVIPVPAPVPTATRPEALLAKLRYIANDCSLAAVLTSQEACLRYRPSSHKAESLAPRWIATDTLQTEAAGGFRDTPNSVLFLQYTSGSTSDPKGVVVSHQNVMHNARATIDHVPIGVSWLPQYHDMGLIGYYLFPLVIGGTTFGLSSTDFLKMPLLWLQTISRVGATYASSPNFGFEYCLREDRLPLSSLQGLDLGSLRVLMNASEPVRADTWNRFCERFAPFGLRQRTPVVAYGLAENTLAVSHYGRGTIHLNKALFQQGIVRPEEPVSSSDNQVALTSCGKPLEGVQVRIVDPETQAPWGEGQIGEIWVAGKSVCQGYWNRPELTRETFHNTIAGEPENPDAYLRTGDLGFVWQQELYVCGRIKDLIIVRGVNYYPHDIEMTVESASAKIRRGGVTAFEDEAHGLALLVEVRSAKDLPDPEEIVVAVRANHSLDAHTVVFVSSGGISRTTSGKMARARTRTRWLNGEICPVATHTFEPQDRLGAGSGWREQFRILLRPFISVEDDGRTLAELGIDSLTLVVLVDNLERLTASVRNEVDARMIQQMTTREFFLLLDRLETASNEPLASVGPAVHRTKQLFIQQESERMRSDAVLDPAWCVGAARAVFPVTDVLFTGPTGFFGPFLLNSLLRHTSCTLHVLTRAKDPNHGLHRIRTALRHARLWTPELDAELQKRIRVVSGDLALPRFGMRVDEWDALSSRVQAVFHNAAAVNYVRSYDSLRPHNVEGTRELLRFSFEGPAKEFHLISSTIIFGWTMKGLLLESDKNEEMLNLDFGYAQSKWVSEQLVFAAQRQGLRTRVYRPSFLSTSTAGVGDAKDIAVLLLAFMIKHEMAVNALNQISFIPADIAADNVGLLFRNRHSGTGPYHVTVDAFYSMMDITRAMTLDHGCHFEYYDLPDFIEEMKRRCTKEDPLYPLVNFFVEAQPKLAAMEGKRYNNDRYREMRRISGGREDPSVRETVSHLMTYMQRTKLIDLPVAPAFG